MSEKCSYDRDKKEPAWKLIHAGSCKGYKVQLNGKISPPTAERLDFMSLKRMAVA